MTSSCQYPFCGPWCPPPGIFFRFVPFSPWCHHLLQNGQMQLMLHWCKPALAQLVLLWRGVCGCSLGEVGSLCSGCSYEREKPVDSLGTHVAQGLLEAHAWPPLALTILLSFRTACLGRCLTWAAGRAARRKEQGQEKTSVKSNAGRPSDSPQSSRKAPFASVEAAPGLPLALAKISSQNGVWIPETVGAHGV